MCRSAVRRSAREGLLKRLLGALGGSHRVAMGFCRLALIGPRMIQYAVLLGSDTIQLLAYPVESAIAEKLQAMVALGGANSRMKNFYDLWIFAKHLDFSADSPLKAIDATFNKRDTPVPGEEFEARTAHFAAGHRVQWNAFSRKMGENYLSDAFDKIIEDLKVFVIPALRSLARGEKLAQHWKAGSGWTFS